MAVYIQTSNGLYPVGGQGGQVTKDKIIEALGYTPSNFDGDYDSLNNKPEIIDDGSEELNIVDAKGNIVAKITNEGVQAVNFYVGEEKKEVALKENISNEINLEEINSKISKATSDASSALTEAQEANTLASEAKSVAESASSMATEAKTTAEGKAPASHTHSYNNLTDKPDISVNEDGVTYVADNDNVVKYTDNRGNVIMSVDADGITVTDVKILINGNLVSLAEKIAEMLNASAA